MYGVNPWHWTKWVRTVRYLTRSNRSQKEIEGRLPMKEKRNVSSKDEVPMQVGKDALSAIKRRKEKGTHLFIDIGERESNEVCILDASKGNYYHFKVQSVVLSGNDAI